MLTVVLFQSGTVWVAPLWGVWQNTQICVTLVLLTVLVDELLGQQQVVVKNLESNYRKVPNVSGATILGDGKVALILDTGALVRRSRH